MKTDHPYPNSPGSYGSSGKGKMWEEDQDAGGVDELLAVLGYKVRSSDVANVGQKPERLESLHQKELSLRESMAKPKDGGEKSSLTMIVGGLVAGVALLGGIAYFMAGSSDTKKKKTMVAPGTGRSRRIYRDDFEEDPKTYFHILRKK